MIGIVITFKVEDLALQNLTKLNILEEILEMWLFTILILEVLQLQ